MLTGPVIILTLKVLVTAVTLLFGTSIWAIATGRRRLHGRLNTIFAILTLGTVLGFELLLRLGTDVTATFSDAAREALTVHLTFAIPATALLPLMLWSGRTHRGRLHRLLAVVFTVMWAGTVVTGLFFLPHDG